MLCDLFRGFLNHYIDNDAGWVGIGDALKSADTSFAFMISNASEERPVGEKCYHSREATIARSSQSLKRSVQSYPSFRLTSAFRALAFSLLPHHQIPFPRKQYLTLRLRNP